MGHYFFECDPHTGNDALLKSCKKRGWKGGVCGYTDLQRRVNCCLPLTLSLALSGRGCRRAYQDHHRVLGIGPLFGLRRKLFLLSEVSLYQALRDHYRRLAQTGVPRSQENAPPPRSMIGP